MKPGNDRLRLKYGTCEASVQTSTAGMLVLRATLRLALLLPFRNDKLLSLHQ